MRRIDGTVAARAGLLAGRRRFFAERAQFDIDRDGVVTDVALHGRGACEVIMVKAMTMSNRKLKIEIVVPVEAVDFIEAAGHQSKLNSYFSKIAERYKTSSFRMIERRGRGLRAPQRAAHGVRSGKLNDYE